MNKLLRMNSTVLPNSGAPRSISTSSPHELKALVEEVACAIADAQAALFSGRFADLENCVHRQQALCLRITALQQKPAPAPDAHTDHEIGQLVMTAKGTLHNNLIFAAILRRMRRHLNTLRSLLNGPAPTYAPARPTPTTGKPDV